LKDIQNKKYRVHGKQNENDLTNCKNTVFKNEYRYENKKRAGRILETNFLEMA
jgi:hypothetical protein